MRNFLKLGGAAAGGLFLASCVTYPYQSAFSSCESEASACYRLCEDIPDEGGYVACQSHCDHDIDRCFDQAYSPYASGYGYGGYGGGYGYSSPWYGQYGSWYPGSGYYFSYGGYDRYGYRKKRHHPHPNGGGNNRPPQGNPPPNSNPRGEPRTPPGEREFDRPRKPNRYYRRDLPGNSAPAGSPATSPAPQPRYVPPSREPRRVTPSAPQPTYTPPPQQPSSSPPPAGAEPQSRPVDRGGNARRVNSPRDNGEGSRQPD